MTKADIVAAIADNCGVGRDVAMKAMETVMATIKRASATGQDVYLRGFGTFRIVTRKAKIARNITKGTSISLPERYAVSFKPSRQYKSVLPGKGCDL